VCAAACARMSLSECPQDYPVSPVSPSYPARPHLSTSPATHLLASPFVLLFLNFCRAFAELERRAKEKNTKHDHILLETTGLADPSPLAFTFFANPWIAARFELDSIVCVVDPKHLMQVCAIPPAGWGW